MYNAANAHAWIDLLSWLGAAGFFTVGACRARAKAETIEGGDRFDWRALQWILTAVATTVSIMSLRCVPDVLESAQKVEVRK